MRQGLVFSRIRLCIRPDLIIDLSNAVLIASVKQCLLVIGRNLFQLDGFTFIYNRPLARFVKTGCRSKPETFSTKPNCIYS